MHYFCADLLKYTINFTQGDVFFLFFLTLSEGIPPTVPGPKRKNGLKPTTTILFFLWRRHADTTLFYLTSNQRNVSLI